MVFFETLENEEIGIRNRLTDQRIEKVLLESGMQLQVGGYPVNNPPLSLPGPLPCALKAGEQLLDAPVVILKDSDGIHDVSCTPPHP